MLKKITQGEWETNLKVIQTVGGTYVGCASTEENAIIMSRGPKLYELLAKLAKSNPALLIQIEAILKTR